MRDSCEKTSFFRKKNNVEILNDFFKTEMRFLVLQLNEDEIGPIRYVSDMDTGERMVFAVTSPELYYEED
jgi:hypothetical protein